MKNDLKQYFERLKQLYLNEFNTNPTTPYFDNCNLFVSNPDEEGYAEWLPKEIEEIELKNKEMLNPEVLDFYSSYYYLTLNGVYKEIVFYFPINMYSNKNINTTLKQAIEDGKYYFKDENYILLGTAIKNENDDILVFYDNENDNVFLYDQDYKQKTGDVFKLQEIIKHLSPII